MYKETYLGWIDGEIEDTAGASKTTEFIIAYSKCQVIWDSNLGNISTPGQR